MKRGLCLLLICTSCSSYKPVHLEEARILADLRQSRVITQREGLDPGQAVATALLANPNLRAFRRMRNVAEGEVISESAWQNPELRFSLQDPLRLGFGLRYFPPAPGERSARIEHAKAAQRRILAEIEDRENKLAAVTRTAHARVLMLTEKEALLEQALRLQERVSALVLARTAAFAGTDIDRLLANLRVTELTLERDGVRREKQDALKELALSLGVPENEVPSLRAGQTKAPEFPTTDEELENAALKKRPDLAIAKEAFAEREEQLHLAHEKQRFWPRFLEPGLKKIPDKPTAELELGIELPLFENKGPLEIAEALRDRARDEYIARVQSIRIEVRAAAARLKADATTRDEVHGKLEPLFAETTSLILRMADSGEIDILKLAVLVERLGAVRRKAIEVEFERTRAAIDYELATGTILQGVKR